MIKTVEDVIKRILCDTDIPEFCKEDVSLYSYERKDYKIGTIPINRYLKNLHSMSAAFPVVDKFLNTDIVAIAQHGTADNVVYIKDEDIPAEYLICKFIGRKVTDNLFDTYFVIDENDIEAMVDKLRKVGIKLEYHEELYLEPCPFCGEDVACLTTNIELNELEPHEEPERFTVVCDYQNGGCGAMSGYKETEEKAAKAWTTRAKL